MLAIQNNVDKFILQTKAQLKSQGHDYDKLIHYAESKLINKEEVSDDNNSDSMKGFAIIEASDMDDAINIAKTDPFLNNGGTIRVSKMMEMPQ